jgi:hypothetical protein
MKLLEDIRDLLAVPDPARSPVFLERVDATLTAGYAHALQLEGERWRLQRRLGDVASHSPELRPEMRADEFATVSKKLQSTNDELSRLRGLLRALRDRRTLLQKTA